MRIVERIDIDDAKWDHCVLKASIFRHYGLSYFLDATCERWKAIISDDYDWVWPLPIKKRLISKVYQPLLAQQLGPFGASLSIEEFNMAIDLINKEFWGYNIKFNEAITADFIPKHATHLNVELRLDQSYGILEMGFKRNALSNIRKANKSNLKVVIDNRKTHAVISMFKNGKGSEIEILNSSFYRDVAAIYNAFSKRNQAETWVAILDDKIIAGIMLLKTNNRLLNFFTGSDVTARNTGAMHMLVSSIIKAYAESDYVLDFEGSNDQNLAYFYKSFGGAEKVYLQSNKKWNIPL